MPRSPTHSIKAMELLPALQYVPLDLLQLVTSYFDPPRLLHRWTITNAILAACGGGGHVAVIHWLTPGERAMHIYTLQGQLVNQGHPLSTQVSSIKATAEHIYLEHRHGVDKYTWSGQLLRIGQPPLATDSPHTVQPWREINVCSQGSTMALVTAAKEVCCTWTVPDPTICGTLYHTTDDEGHIVAMSHSSLLIQSASTMFVYGWL